jgi:hypothetical protein
MALVKSPSQGTSKVLKKEPLIHRVFKIPTPPLIHRTLKLLLDSRTLNKLLSQLRPYHLDQEIPKVPTLPLIYRTIKLLSQLSLLDLKQQTLPKNPKLAQRTLFLSVLLKVHPLARLKGNQNVSARLLAVVGF